MNWLMMEQIAHDRMSQARRDAEQYRLEKQLPQHGRARDTDVRSAALLVTVLVISLSLIIT